MTRIRVSGSCHCASETYGATAVNVLIISESRHNSPRAAVTLYTIPDISGRIARCPPRIKESKEKNDGERILSVSRLRNDASLRERVSETLKFARRLRIRAHTYEIIFLRAPARANTRISILDAALIKRRSARNCEKLISRKITRPRYVSSRQTHSDVTVKKLAVATNFPECPRSFAVHPRNN